MEHFDIVIIGAGLSGIDAACHFKMKTPKKTFTIFEGRSGIGGTWDLFKYPGIRSDSDMHTFSYRFKPWTHKKTISDAATIMDYLQETVTEYDIEKHIQYNHNIEELSWSSKSQLWTVTGLNKATGKPIQVTCNFLMSCTGYYDYEEGYTPDYTGVENFKGKFVHPQKWTADIEYENKNVVVIGSGATAVTLIPSMAQKAKHITLLQRSPSYILSRPTYDKFAGRVHKYLPAKPAHFLARWKGILQSMYLYDIARKNPKGVKKYIQNEIKKVLGKEYAVDVHFNPKYNPWDERLCAVPDNDLFHTIKEGKCTMVTDHIDSFTENGIRLQSGQELEADLVVSATGLKLKVVGGINVVVDGEKIDTGKVLTYKGVMLQDVPNFATIIGYTNASWTLKADLACSYICRLLKYMDRKKLKSCVPRLLDAKIETVPMIDFSSGYVKRGIDKMPKQGNQFPWKLHQNYVKDLITLRYKKIADDCLVFKR